MKTVMLRLAVAVALAAGAWFTWTKADAATREAEAKQHIVTLRYADVDADVDALTNATVSYWVGQYGNVVAETDASAADAELLRTAANAAFRDSQREIPGAGNREPGAVVQRLDVVLQAYASALKASARDVETAYNYEYVTRLRDQVARSQGRVKLTPAPVATMVGDLPAGPTIHGKPGMPPPEAKMEDLEMLAPLEYGDREAQPEATPGAKRERKG
ncbi:MAG TPA: hypothetical protein VJ691_00145 [Vicinamibacterales bacterium]|nr:hypothetical protein [Vicinamibacterales bacterium]